MVKKYNADQSTHKMIRSIKNALPDLLKLLADINTKTLEILTKDKFKEIQESIERKIGRTSANNK